MRVAEHWRVGSGHAAAALLRRDYRGAKAQRTPRASPLLLPQTSAAYFSRLLHGGNFFGSVIQGEKSWIRVGGAWGGGLGRGNCRWVLSLYLLISLSGQTKHVYSTQNVLQSRNWKAGFAGQERVNPYGVLMYVRAGSCLCSAQLGLRAFVPCCFS